MKQRQKYKGEGENIFHKLRTNEIARERDFVFQESFLIKLNECLLLFFDKIISDKLQQKKKPVIHFYDLSLYAKQLLDIILMKGGIKKDER